MVFFEVEHGTPADYELELEHIDGGLYGLTFTGFRGCSDEPAAGADERGVGK